jgi:hypothetical protein
VQRSECDEQTTRLCAAYNVPANAERLDAYWTAFGKLGAVEFARMIEHCLTDQGPEKMPSVRQVWDVRRQLRTRIPTTAANPAELDHVGFFANRMLWEHVNSRQGLSNDELTGVLDFKRTLVNQFCEYIRAGDDLATPNEFLRQWVLGLEKLSAITELTRAKWRRMFRMETGNRPFEPHMGRMLAS